VIGVIPYVGLNFAVYETLKANLMESYGEQLANRERFLPSHVCVCAYMCVCVCEYVSHVTMRAQAVLRAVVMVKDLDASVTGG
jgi:hypothetical protein